MIGVKKTANPKTCCDLNGIRGVFDKDYLLGQHLGDVQRESNDVRVKLQLANLIHIQFMLFVRC